MNTPKSLGEIRYATSQAAKQLIHITSHESFKETGASISRSRLFPEEAAPLGLVQTEENNL